MRKLDQDDMIDVMGLTALLWVDMLIMGVTFFAGLDLSPIALLFLVPEAIVAAMLFKIMETI